MATSWTDPSLTQAAMQASDVLLFMRPIVSSTTCQVTGYQPYNITASDLAVSIVNMGLLLIVQTLPASAPEGGGFWLNNGGLAYSPVTGTASGEQLTPEALAASLKALLAASPAMGDTWNFNGFQNNAGVVTEVDDGSGDTPSGPSSSTALTPAAFTASLKQALATYPAMGATTNYNGFQNNAGVATEVDDGT